MALNGKKLKIWAKSKFQEYKHSQAAKEQIRKKAKTAYLQAKEKEAIEYAKIRAKRDVRRPSRWQSFGKGISSGLGALGRGAVNITGYTLGDARKPLTKPKYKTYYKKKGNRYIKVRKKIGKIKEESPRYYDHMLDLRNSFGGM